MIAGGPAVSGNPEPVAPMLDAVIIGEVEPVMAGLQEETAATKIEQDNFRRGTEHPLSAIAGS